MITATLTFKGQKYPVNIIGSKKFGRNQDVTLHEVEVTNGFEPFTRFTHGGPANYNTGYASRRTLSNIKINGIPAQRYVWARESKIRAARQPQKQPNAPAPAGAF